MNIRMKAPKGSDGISQGNVQLIVDDTGHVLVPMKMLAEAQAHGFVISHEGNEPKHTQNDSAATQTESVGGSAALGKILMPGDNKAAEGALKKTLSPHRRLRPMRQSGAAARRKSRRKCSAIW